MIAERVIAGYVVAGCVATEYVIAYCVIADRNGKMFPQMRNEKGSLPGGGFFLLLCFAGMLAELCCRTALLLKSYEQFFVEEKVRTIPTPAARGGSEKLEIWKNMRFPAAETIEKLRIIFCEDNCSYLFGVLSESGEANEERRVRKSSGERRTGKRTK